MRTLLTFLSLLTALCVGALPALASNAVGVRQLELPAGTTDHKLQVVLWYPTDSTQSATLNGQSRVFTGQLAVSNAAPAAGRHPLILLSHGYGGYAQNQNWLASVLAQQGYIVAAPTHPGTSSADLPNHDNLPIWTRPRDLSRIIDALSQDRQWQAHLDLTRIAAIGHSLGGWTVMAAAGARFDLARFSAECQQHPELAACLISHQGQLWQNPQAQAALSQPLQDARIKAVVTLDLGLARGFDPASLAKLPLPVLVLAAGETDPALPAALESHYLAAQLPAAHTRYVEIAGASHFSFLPACQPDAQALLQMYGQGGDEVICQHGSAAEREPQHAQIAALISAFLAQQLP